MAKNNLNNEYNHHTNLVFKITYKIRKFSIANLFLDEIQVNDSSRFKYSQKLEIFL